MRKLGIISLWKKNEETKARRIEHLDEVITLNWRMNTPRDCFLKIFKQKINNGNINKYIISLLRPTKRKRRITFELKNYKHFESKKNDHSGHQDQAPRKSRPSYLIGPIYYVLQAPCPNALLNQYCLKNAETHGPTFQVSEKSIPSYQ